jgi:hypothetical protein
MVVLPYNPHYVAGIDRRTAVPGQPRQKTRAHFKNKLKAKAWGVAQVVEHLQARGHGLPPTTKEKRQILRGQRKGTRPRSYNGATSHSSTLTRWHGGFINWTHTALRLLLRQHCQEGPETTSAGPRFWICFVWLTDLGRS